MKFIAAFKEFATRGNVIDLAVGVVIGTAFGKIVTSFVGDVMMPLINPLIPGGDWRGLEVGTGIKLGSFAGTVLDFIIVALAIFMMVKGINRLNRKKQEEAATVPEPTNQEKLLAEIRDLLKNR